MLCMQQCINLCDLAPEEAEAIRQGATLAEILAIQAACPRSQGADANIDAESAANCGMLDLRDRLLDADCAVDDVDDLEDVVQHYRADAESEARDLDIAAYDIAAYG